MSTLKDALTSVQHSAEADFASTSLSNNLRPVKNRVMRDRTATYAVGGLGVAVFGAGAVYGLGQAPFGLPQVDPAGPVPETSSSASATPSTSASSLADSTELIQSEDIVIVAGTTASTIATKLAETFGVGFSEAYGALLAASPDGDPEGWAAPGAYELPAGTTLDEAVQEMVTRQQSVLDELGVSQDEAGEVLTIASLIEREAKRDEDRAMISAVIHHRLDQDMPLQLDSTVFYVSGSEELFSTDEERQIDSPYNTYLHYGLPPGPIATPSVESIEAALAPADSDVLYFVTVNLETGETLFASTYDEHQENVLLLQEWIAANTAE